MICLMIIGSFSSYAQIAMPIEVLGVHQTEESRDFSITNSSTAKYLYLRVNNFSVDGKVEVSFNNSGVWTGITNANANIPMPESGFGGIGGGYSTIRTFLDISSTSLLEGDNTIHLRFNAENDSISVGYRVIEFNILDDANVNMIAASSFEEEDPATWTAPFTDQTSIDEGEDLWRNAELLSPSLSNKTIKARCMDCHAQDGRDLKYFNYSNKSIETRSVYHGLTAEEGQKIASYIRNLSTPAPEIARPWNPPYQPGPGLDDKPAEEWAAGAGLDAVLESDADMMDYLFPNGTSDEELAKVFDLDGTLNIREMPIALQMPDWKHWLPQIHPKDMMSDASYSDLINGVGGVRNHRVKGEYGYQVIRDDFEANGVSVSTIFDKIDQLAFGAQDFLYHNPTDVSGGNWWWTVKASDGISEKINAFSGMLVEDYKMNIAQWNSVKHWEIMQEFDVEAVQPTNVPKPEARQWPSSNWTVFAIAPHIIGDSRGQSKLVGQDQEVGYYFSTAWYQLQMVLNSGMKAPIAVAPVDWAYNFDHVTKSSIYTGHMEPLRLFQNFLKCYEQRNNSDYQTGDLATNSAWNMREVSPWRLWSTARGETAVHETLDDYEDGLRAKLIGQMINMFIEKVSTMTSTDWLREDETWWALEPADHKPTIDARNIQGSFCLFPNANGTTCTDIQNAVEANAIYSIIPKFQSIEVDCDAVEALRSWADSMWPLGDWDSYYDGTCSDGYYNGLALVRQSGGEVVTVLEDQETYDLASFPETFLNVRAYTHADGKVGSVRFTVNDGEQSYTDNQAPFSLYGDGAGYQLWTPEAGDYEVKIEIFESADAAGELLDEATVSYTWSSTVTDVAPAVQLSIYPNPASDKVYLSMSTEWQLVTLQGHIIESGNNTEISIQHLSNGIYLLKTDDKLFKLIKN